MWDDLEIHHIIPLEYSHLFPGVNPNRMGNLAGMSRPSHQRVSNEWTQFRAGLNGRSPSDSEVMSKALEIHDQFGHTMQFVRQR